MNLYTWTIYLIFLSLFLSGCSLDNIPFFKTDHKNLIQSGSLNFTGTHTQALEISTVKNTSDILLQYPFRDLYDAVFSPNQNGIRIVKKGDSFGMISQSGSIILDVKYQKIQKNKTGSYSFDDGFVLSNGKIIFLSDHPKLQQFQSQPLNTSEQLWILDNFGEKVIFETNTGDFFYDIQGKEIILPPVYRSIWRIDDELIGAIGDGVINISKIDQTPIYESTGYTGGYSFQEEKPTFHDGLMVMQDDSGLYGFIDKGGNWKIQPTYDQVMSFTGGRAFVTNKTENDFIYTEIDTSGKSLRTLTRDEIINMMNYPKIHPDFLELRSLGVIQNKKTGAIFANRKDITSNPELSNIAIKKGEKWGVYGFDDYSFDYIIFWFINGHAGVGWSFPGGLALASKEGETYILNTNTNQIIFTFNKETVLFDHYGGSIGFFILNDNLIAVQKDGVWDIINLDGEIIKSGYERIDVVQDEYRLSVKPYFIGTRGNVQFLITGMGGQVEEYPLGSSFGSAEMLDGVIAIYDKVSLNEPTTSGQEYSDQLSRDMQGKKPSLIGYLYFDGYEKILLKK